jgi:hypothetical protein
VKLLIQTFPTHIRFEIFMVAMPLKCWNLAAKNYVASHHQDQTHYLLNTLSLRLMVLQAAQHLTGIGGKFPDPYINIAIVKKKIIEM